MPAPLPPARWLALDVFRALAVVWMIQGHTFTALLRTDLYTGAWVQPYALLHGLTAPMFLFGAGVAYAIVMFPAAGPAPGSRRIVRRALSLLAIGTLLQLPAAPLQSILLRRDLLTATLQPGALQLVAVCLLCAEAVRRLTPHFTRVVCALAAVFALLAPWVWQRQLSSSLLLGGWFDGQAGAQFPVLPWICFFLLGATLASAFGSSLWLQRWRMPWFGLLGLASSAACYALYLRGERLNALYGPHPFWFSNPLFVLFRAGLVCAWLGALSGCGRAIALGFTRYPRCAGVLAALARHSLVAYVIHLLLLYGTPLTPGFARGGARFDLLGSVLALAVVLGATVAGVLVWQRWVGSGELRAALQRFTLAHARATRASDAPRW